MCVYVQGSPAAIQTPTPSESERPHHDYPAACVIAQQYSPTTFVTWRFHSHKENFGSHFRNVIKPIFFFFTFLKAASVWYCASLNCVMWTKYVYRPCGWTRVGSELESMWMWVMALSWYVPDELEENNKKKKKYSVLLEYQPRFEHCFFKICQSSPLLNQFALYVKASSQCLYCLVVPVKIAFTRLYS